MSRLQWFFVEDGRVLDKSFTYTDAYMKLLMSDPLRLKKECVRLVETERLFVYSYLDRLVMYVREDLIRQS